MWQSLLYSLGWKARLRQNLLRVSCVTWMAEGKQGITPGL